MTRRLYLLRHGTPEFPECGPYVYGRTDYPLSELGKEDAENLGEFLQAELKRPFTVYTSPLKRARDTATPLIRLRDDANEPIIITNFAEFDMGTWDGKRLADLGSADLENLKLLFSDPEKFVPAGGETLQEAQARFADAMFDVLSKDSKDVVVFAHAAVNILFLSYLGHASLAELQKIIQPYGCYNIFKIEGTTLVPEVIGGMPTKAPSKARIELLRDSYKMSQFDREHADGVAEIAMSLYDLLKTTEEIKLDPDVLYAAAKLHDLRREAPKHALAGQRTLEFEGYPEVAKVIGNHTDLPAKHRTKITESSLVFLADKAILGDKPVGIEMRFRGLTGAVDDDKYYKKSKKRRDAAYEVLATLSKYVDKEHILQVIGGA
ncbi:MAG: hypothetical protein GX326_06290 [Clostridiaceae bacterium]|nr:hypothetical protein [Clostridiaceae bacterium]